MGLLTVGLLTVGLLTVGHGRLDQPSLAALLTDAGVAEVVDVRRFPGSRTHPHTRREEMARWLPDVGIGYRWDVRLGGRRTLPPASPDTWWEVPAFRAYAAHMRSPEFAAAASMLLAGAGTARRAVLCSEAVWWRCHRRLIADFAVLARGVMVRHLGHDGRLIDHAPATGARLTDGLLVYDAPR